MWPCPHVPTPAGPPRPAWPFSHCSQGPQTLKLPSIQIKQEGNMRTASCEGDLGAAHIGKWPTDGDEETRVEAPARRPAILGQRVPLPLPERWWAAGPGRRQRALRPAAAVAWALGRREISLLPAPHAESTCVSRPVLPGLIFHSPESGTDGTVSLKPRCHPEQPGRAGLR